MTVSMLSAKICRERLKMWVFFLNFVIGCETEYYRHQTIENIHVTLTYFAIVNETRHPHLILIS